MQNEISVILKGPTFCPSTRGTFLDAKSEITGFTRKLKIREKYFDHNFKNEALVKEKSNNPVICKNSELNRIIDHIENIAPEKVTMEPNITQRETQALNTLKSYSDIIIKKADKGGMFVIMDKNFYRDKMVLKDHLNTKTYKIVSRFADNKVMRNLKEHTKKHSKCLHESEIKYINNKHWKSSNIYVTPKVHKCKTILDIAASSNQEYIHLPCPPDLKGRPIIAGPQSPTQRLSELVEKILSPLVPLLKSYVKDDWDFIRRLPRMTSFECEIYSVDIVSLYTNIPHKLGLEAVEYYIDKHRNKIPKRFTKEFILESIKFVLTNNNFFFDGICRHQEEGTAMGSKMAPPYANLSIGYLEETKLYPSLPQHFPVDIVELIIKWFLRYIDDGFVLWPKGLLIDTLLKLLNSLNPNIRFTLEISRKYTKGNIHYQELSFLDILVIVTNFIKFTTDIFYKDTNSHFYLDYNSHHPQHIKDNIPYNLAKKLICFIPDEERLEYRLNELKTWLLKRNYPSRLIDKKFHNAKLQGPAPPPSPQNNPNNRLIFTTTYTNNFSHKNTIQQINSLFHLPRTDRIKKVFGNCTVMQAYKQPKNLLHQLTKAAFTSTPQQNKDEQEHENNKVGLFKCGGPKCKLCKLYIQPCASFITQNGTEWHIKSKIDCNSLNVIYWLKCMKCNQKDATTNTGKTWDFRERMNNHITACRHGGSTDLFDEHVYECKKKHPDPDIEPYFHIYAFMTVRKENLLTYEKHLHRKGYDTINAP